MQIEEDQDIIKLLILICCIVSQFSNHTEMVYMMVQAVKQAYLFIQKKNQTIINSHGGQFWDHPEHIKAQLFKYNANNSNNPTPIKLSQAKTAVKSLMSPLCSSLGQTTPDQKVEG